MRFFIYIIAAVSIATSLARGDELILTHDEIVRQGFVPAPPPATPVSPDAGLKLPPPFGSHSLAWPVPFQDAQHTIGNVMGQYQNYGDAPYYHGGDDLRVQEREMARAPISGRLEAGHYSYETLPDGSNKKYWKPWPQSGNSMYFEVAIVTPQGYRFELHHIDRDALTPAVLSALKSPQPTVTEGTELGRVVEWPMTDTDGTYYHHTHYNIIAPDGAQLNPEHYSQLMGDKLPPVISCAYAVLASGKSAEFGQGHFRERPEEFVVVAADKLAANIYSHTPAYTRLVFDNGAETTWDFRERLTMRNGKFPPIWEFFRESLDLPDGRTITTEGNYSSRNFLLRLKVPQGARGKFRIEIGDAAGNLSTLSGELD